MDNYRQYLPKMVPFYVDAQLYTFFHKDCGKYFPGENPEDLQ